MADNKCDFCGNSEVLPFDCRYCGGVYCSAHRLPEYHECSGLKALKEKRTITGVPLRKFTQPRKKKKSAWKFPAIRLPARGKYAFIIMGIILITYLLQMVPGFTDMFILGGNSTLSKPWTIVTYMFLHGGIVHIVLNLITLFFFGTLLERQVGSARFLGVYFASGILAGIVQVLLFPAALVLGASGAIFGVMGALTVLMPNYRIYIIFVPMKLIFAVIVFALIDIVMLSTGDGIAHGVHLVGLGSGLVFGYLLKKRKGPLQAHWHT